MTSSTTKGEKRICQNEDCALPFYDLNREAFDCPNCGTPFDLTAPEPEVVAAAAAAGRYPSRRTPREYQIVAPEDNVMPEEPKT
jgi:hypothetical protein